MEIVTEADRPEGAVIHWASPNVQARAFSGARPASFRRTKGGWGTALNRFEAGVVTRGKGQSAIARAAYNAREKLVDQRTNEAKDYRYIGEPEWKGIFAPDHAGDWVFDRERLWNAVELREDQSTRPNQAQLARDLKVALPHELTAEQRRDLVREFARELADQGMVVDVAIHAPHANSDARNHHVHILLTMRELTPEGFGNKVREWNRETALESWRERWSELGARHLERAGFEVESERFRVGHLTLAKQREAALERGDHEAAKALDREPAAHMGPQATAMERQGIPTRKGDINHEISQRNEARARENENPWTIGREKIREVWSGADSPADFRYALWTQGYLLARVDAGAARRSTIDHENAQQQGRYCPRLREGEYVIVDESLRIFRLTPRTTGDNFADIDRFLKPLDHERIFDLTRVTDFLRPREEANDRFLRGALPVWWAYNTTRDVQDFERNLKKEGLHLARVTQEDATASQTHSWVAAREGKYRPVLSEGEYVALNERGQIYRLNNRSVGESSREVQAFLAPLDKHFVNSLRATENFIDFERNRDQGLQRRRSIGELVGNEARLPTRVSRAAERAAGQMLEFAASAVESLLAPTLTPQQKRAAWITQLDREAEAAEAERRRDHGRDR